MAVDQLVDIAIVGGGFSGVAVAAQVARRDPDLRVAMFERRGWIGPGVAYATRHAVHLTNSRAANMSAFEDDPNHFVRWLDGRAGPDEFVPRHFYGEYLRSIAESLTGPTFSTTRAWVRKIDIDTDGTFRIRAGDGSECLARAVVLATGNLASETDGIPPALLEHPRFVADPYRTSYDGIHGDVLIVGSGLSALDAIAALDAASFVGTIHTLSRHGLFPLPDVRGAAYAGQLGIDASNSAARVLRDVRRFVRDGQRAGDDWRALVEAVRTEVPRLWRALDLRERGRFVRHAQRYWSVHRHRAPEQLDAIRSRLLAEARLIVHRGRITAIGDGPDAIEVRIAGRDGDAVISVAHVINARGPTGDYRRSSDPLVQDLIASGSVVPAPLALGLIETRPGIFLAGPAERWHDYEATGIPELRRKAAGLAERLVRHLAGGPPS